MCETRRWWAAPHKVIFINIVTMIIIINIFTTIITMIIIINTFTMIIIINLFTMIIFIIMISMISTTQSCCENLTDYQSVSEDVDDGNWIILTISKNRLGLLYHLTLFHNEAEQFVPLEHRMPIQVNN